MFEKYTTKSRRAIFFARYEASQVGAPAIGTEHLLLGLLREEQSILSRFFPAHASVDSIRKQIEGRILFRKKIPTAVLGSTTRPLAALKWRMLFRKKTPTAVAIPLSVETKNVLRYAVEEADSLSHSEIKPEHFLLGLFREKDSLGAEVLRENGVEHAVVHKELEKDVEG